MKNFERRIKKIENWEAKLPGYRGVATEGVIILIEPPTPCMVLDSKKCPDYIRAKQSSSGVALCIPSCGDCKGEVIEG